MQDIFGGNECDFNEFFKFRMIEMTTLIEGRGNRNLGAFMGFVLKWNFTNGMISGV